MPSDTGPATDTGNAVENGHDGSDDSHCGHSREQIGVSRRAALAAAGSLSFAVTAGCLDSVRGIGGSREPVTPADPGDDPQGTPAEFYFLLEENGITVDELYYDTEDKDVILFYESAAEDEMESDDEIAVIYRVFSGSLIERGADIEHLYTEVLDRFDGQVKGWGVNAEWAEQHSEGEISDIDLWNAIVQTKVYEGTDTTSPEAEANTSTAAGGDDDT